MLFLGAGVGRKPRISWDSSGSSCSYSFCPPRTKGTPKANPGFVNSAFPCFSEGSGRLRAVFLLRTTNLGSWMCQMTPRRSSLAPSLPPQPFFILFVCLTRPARPRLPRLFPGDSPPLESDPESVSPLGCGTQEGLAGGHRRRDSSEGMCLKSAPSWGFSGFCCRVGFFPPLLFFFFAAVFVTLSLFIPFPRLQW